MDGYLEAMRRASHAPVLLPVSTRALLHPDGLCGRAENEREYGGDNEERPSGGDGVDRAERWYCPSGNEVPNYVRQGENHAHEAVDVSTHVLVNSVCEEDLPEHFLGAVEHTPDEPEHKYRPQCRVQSHAQADGTVAESGDAHPPAFGYVYPPGACADAEFS